ncbi:MAG: PhoPQ-activated pathogenicity-related family protein [Gammaproteobacteria bacterium]|nr:PhoPQ-activated pathogenicity-related family protein [Gammaproteobacteria bacterium]
MFTLDKLLCRGEFLRKRAAFTAVLVITSALAAGPVFAGPDTALDDYVNEPDPVYRFDPIGLSIPFADFTVHNLRVISQQWRSPEEVDQTVWDHLLTIIVPRRVVSETSLMFVLGGNNPIQLPDLDSDALQALALIATSSGTVVSALQQVPNQPLMFADDPISNNMRSEDQLVAFTFDRATRTGDYTWPAYLPMVKSVVRAMDAVQDFVPDATDAAVNNAFCCYGFFQAWRNRLVNGRCR